MKVEDSKLLDVLEEYVKLEKSKRLYLSKIKTGEYIVAAPQTITEIDHIKYLKIKKEGGIDERFTVN